MYVSNQTILDPIDFHSTTKERNVKNKRHENEKMMTEI